MSRLFTMLRSTRLWASILLGLSAGEMRGQFVAFNDHAPGSGTSTNATTWNILGTSPGAKGALKNISSGLVLPVTLTITTNGPITTGSSAGNPNVGTPLYNVFNGYVDFKATNRSDAVVMVPADTSVTYTFTGLNPSKVYSFKGGAVRGGVGDTYPQRWTQFEIFAAASWVNAHTAGCLTNGLNSNAVAINTGVNTNGDMVDWERIVASQNGTFSVRSIQYTNTIPAGGTANGPYGYALTGLRLEEMVVGPPAISSLTSTASVIQVVFSLPVDPISATNPAHYSLAGAYGNPSILKAGLGTDSRTVQLVTSDQIPFGAYTLGITNVADALTGTNYSRISQGYTNVGFTTGYLKTEFYSPISGTTIASLTNNSKYPNSPSRVIYNTNDAYWYDSSLGANYGTRWSGYLVPPATGPYNFMVLGAATTVNMFLSTNDNPALKTLVLTATSASSAAITLQQNQKYYFEVLYKEGSSASDYLYIGWQGPGIAWELIPSVYTGGYVNAAGASVNFTQQPANTTVYIGLSAVLNAQATCSSTVVQAPNYQWQRNGVNIPGANSSSYVTPRLDLTNNGDVYRVLAYVPGAVRVGSNATVVVKRDLDPPTISQIFNFGPNRVQLVFSETVDPASATNTANYVFTNGLAIISASLDLTNKTVTLLTDRLLSSSNYTIVVNGVTDQAVDHNMIATNTTVSFTAGSPSSLDIGMAARTVSTVLSNGVSITALGTGIGNSSDQFNFNWQQCSGDFDLRVRMAGVSPSDVWAKAGLMARETANANSRFVATLATPAMNGCQFSWRDTVGGVASSSSSTYPVNYPDTWVRLLRLGNNFSGFASYDGTNWANLGSVYLQLSNIVFVGFATSSHNSSTPVTATFLDFGAVGPEARLATVDNPHDDLGPSSRRTPIVFSEIMYKPAPRTDSNNLEFIEIYNSNPYFHDISGYQIIAGSLSYTFPANTIIPGASFQVIAASPGSLRSVYGISNVMGPYTGSLKKDDTLQLIDENGAILLTVPYSRSYPWPVAADGTGHSIVLANPTYGEADPRAWDISDVVGGSPGQMDAFRPDPRRNVMINEVLAHSSDTNVLDFIELYNHNPVAVDLSGCILTDDPALARFVIPKGTTVAAGGFVSFDRTQLGFGLSALGETVYFFNPDMSRALDAMQFDAQADGISFGRWPDGANALYPLSARTPGAANSSILIRDIVINELMYKPISGNDDDQYIELYNKGANTVSLGGWQFTSGITFTFPASVTLAPDSYLVIARNQTNLFARYSNLSTANTIGDYGSKLPHGGGRVALAMPQPYVTSDAHGFVTNTIYVTADEVTYGTGGHWGQWSSGGGSSLELIDPRSNHRIADNWADSDETQKSSWTNIETTGVMDNGANYGNSSSVYNAQIGLLDVGECLVDNIEVHINGNAANNVLNSDFESGLANWTLDGCMSRSSWESTGFSSGHSLHIRCSDRVWTGVNSCQATLTPFAVGIKQSATLRFKARWLHGWPEALLRLNGNWLEAAGAMPVPTNLGTPGMRNSRCVVNAGPAIYEVTHFPTVPTYSDNVIVTARVHDPDGIKSVTLRYRDDSSATYTSVPMNDSGTNGDLVAGDGIYTAPVTPYMDQIQAFFISAVDSRGATNRFPELVDDNGPVRECLVRFGDPKPGGSFGVYHYWVSDASAQKWSSMPNLSNEYHDGTLVNGKRVIYNMQGRYAGSPYHQLYSRPDNDICHFKWDFPADDKFHGVTSYNKMHAPGNGPGDDYMLQREQVANSFLRTLGVPWISRRFVALYVNGYRGVQLMEDAACPGSDTIAEFFPNDKNGYLWKMQPWFEFASSTSGTSIGFDNKSWCSIMPLTTTGGAKKTAAYRYMFLGRQTPDSLNNYTNVFSLVDAANAYRYPEYVKDMENIADMENWMRVFAANHAAGNWDSYGAQNAQNLYGYLGTQGAKYSLMMFDFNIVLGNAGSWAPGQNLFTVNSADPNTTRIFTTPEFRRMYWRALQELLAGPLNIRNSGPLIDAKYSVFTSENLGVQDPTDMKNWISSASTAIANQLAGENPAAFTVNSSPYLGDNQLTLTGTAPVNIKTVLINGVQYPLTWSSVSTWRISVPLKPGLNTLNIQGVDLKGHPVAGSSGSMVITVDELVPSPAGLVVISEIMYNPIIPGAQYVELYNSSPTFTYDLSGWRIKELDYTFPPGATLLPSGTYLIALDQFAFAAAYGARYLVSDLFGTPLSTTGGTLTLSQPVGDPREGTVVARVRYENTMPWPGAANGTGSSLQLIDPTRPNWRVYNWSSTFPPKSLSPSQANPTLGTVPVLPDLWLNEAQPENLSGITNSAGQLAGWIELYNPTTNTVALDSVYLANNYTNLSQWAFPAGSVIEPSQFMRIFTDGRTDLSTSNELHASFTLTPANGSVALSAQNPLLDSLAPPVIVDYFNYTNLPANHSYGSFPDGQVFTRKEFFFPTPGASNNPSGSSMTIVINEFMAGNTHTITNPIGGKDDWFELYNYGDSTVDLSGCYLSHTIGVPAESIIPAGYSIPPKGFLLVWADKQTTNGTRDLHANFRLSKSGSSIGLYATNLTLVDFVSFGRQTSDVSRGRFPDGGPDFYQMTTPTPRDRNLWINTAPTLGPSTNWTITQGQAVSFTAQAVDPDVPPQFLTFSLGAGSPEGAVIDPYSGYFMWRSTDPGTNVVTIVVSDSGTPSLSATQLLVVVVMPMPQLQSIAVQETYISATWTTYVGQAYQLEYKDDLSWPSWLAAGGRVVGTGDSKTLVMGISGSGQRFYRLRLVP